MTDQPEAHGADLPAPEPFPDAIGRFEDHPNPFGRHPDGIGPTLGGDLEGEVAPAAPA